MSQELTEFGTIISGALPAEITNVEIVRDQLVLWTRVESVVPVLTFLRDDPACLFKMLVDLTAVDYPERPERFEVVYNLLSLRHNRRVRLKIAVEDGSSVPSIARILGAASWYEREVWDMFGIPVSGHPDMRRILTDYGFEGHPLRKDFPLTGYVEVRYDDEQKRVVYEPVKLAQEFRSFDFVSPWEGMNTLLPGDEKAGTNQ